MKLTPLNLKKWLSWIAGIFLFLLLLNLGIGFWIKNRIPAIIEEKNDTPYDFAYEDLSFSLFNSSLSIEGISLMPKKNISEKIPLDFTAKVEEIKLVGVDFFKLLRTKNLAALRLDIIGPEVVYYKSLQKDTIKTQSQLGTIIDIDKFRIENANFQLYDFDKKTKLAYFQNLNMEIKGVNFSQKTLEKNIPFTYEKFKMTSGKIFYQINPLQNLKASGIQINDNVFFLNNLEIQSEEGISKVDPKKVNFRLVPDVKAPQLRFTGLDWGFSKTDKFYFNAELVKFDSVDFFVRNTRERPKDTVISRGSIIPFDLNIQKIQVDKSRLRLHESLDVQNINLEINQVQNVLGQKLNVQKIQLNHPTIITYSGKKTIKKADHATEDFEDYIQVQEVKLQDATYYVKEFNSKKNLLKVNQVNFSLKNIEMTPETYQKTIPLTYQSLMVKASSLDYNPNSIYSLKTKDIRFENGHFNLKNFEMKPKISRSEFVKQLPKEKDLYTLSAESVNVPNLKWGFKRNVLSIAIQTMEIQKVHANVYRSKIPPDDPKKKELYSKLLRELPFFLEVNQLKLKNSQVEYEEETAESTGAGKLTFSNFNADIQNIYSGYGRKSTPDLVATIQTNFMNDSKLHAVWSFNPMNRAEKFTIKGSLYHFDAKKMTPFVKPYLHATMEGDMQEVRFNFTGNDVDANGDFGIKYQNLKVKLYNPETGKERKVVNAVGNLLVKSSTKDQYKEVQIKTVTRNQDRSFFNFFWNCVLQGLKQTLLII